MPEIGRIIVKVESVSADATKRAYAKGNRKLQNNLSKIVQKMAENVQKNIQRSILTVMPPAYDTGTLYDAIIIVKTGPYEYKVGDLEYPVGVQPYGIYVEKGFKRHFVPRDHFFVNEQKMGKLTARITELDNVRLAKGQTEMPGLMVGPMPARPYHSFGVLASLGDNMVLVKDSMKDVLSDFK